MADEQEVAGVRGRPNAPQRSSRDGIYWFSFAAMVFTLIVTVAKGMTVAAAITGVFVGVCLAVPPAYDLGRRRGVSRSTSG